MNNNNNNPVSEETVRAKRIRSLKEYYSYFPSALKNVPMGDLQKAKISLALKSYYKTHKRVVSEATKQKMRDSKKGYGLGRRASEATKAKMSESRKKAWNTRSRVVSEATKLKKSVAMKAYYANKENL